MTSNKTRQGDQILHSPLRMVSLRAEMTWNLNKQRYTCTSIVLSIPFSKMNEAYFLFVWHIFASLIILWFSLAQNQSLNKLFQPWFIIYM